MKKMVRARMAETRRVGKMRSANRCLILASRSLSRMRLIAEFHRAWKLVMGLVAVVGEELLFGIGFVVVAGAVAGCVFVETGEAVWGESALVAVVCVRVHGVVW